MTETEESKTCGECGWRKNEGLWGNVRCKGTGSNTWIFQKECPARKAYRVLRDEVRRLRARHPLEVFYENAFRLCGVEVGPDRKVKIK